jgi:hypothetical protein
MRLASERDNRKDVVTPLGVDMKASCNEVQVSAFQGLYGNWPSWVDDRIGFGVLQDLFSTTDPAYGKLEMARSLI